MRNMENYSNKPGKKQRKLRLLGIQKTCPREGGDPCNLRLKMRIKNPRCKKPSATMLVCSILHTSIVIMFLCFKLVLDHNRRAGVRTQPFNIGRNEPRNLNRPTFYPLPSIFYILPSFPLCLGLSRHSLWRRRMS